LLPLEKCERGSIGQVSANLTDKVLRLAENRARLIVVCGLPGSGKTTHAKRLEQELDAIRFCPDEWFEALSLDLYDEARRAKIEALQWQLAQRLLRRGVSVIIEWGTWGKTERDALRVGARDIGVPVELHYLCVPVDALFERIQRRGMESPPITRKQLLDWVAIFQEPTPEEISLFDDYRRISPSCC
jgi:predicted kinase